MLTIYDELPHQALADEYWRESWYLNFFDHSSGLYGIAWMGVRPNAGHGEILFAIGRDYRFLHVFSEFEIPISADIGRERTSFGPLAFAVLEPYERWRITFSDGATDVDLEWEALTPVYNWEWQDTTRSWHYQHPGRVTGTIAVGDERHSFDGLGERDRAWGKRDNRFFEANHWITAQFESGLCFEAQALPVGGEHQLFGFVQHEGVSSLLAELRMTPNYAYPGGPPAAALLEARDELGREFELRQELMNVYGMGSALDGREIRQYFTFNRFYHGGEMGYGMVDHWWSDNHEVEELYVCKAPNRGSLISFEHGEAAHG